MKESNKLLMKVKKKVLNIFLLKILDINHQFVDKKDYEPYLHL